jgi:hypothetical protein
VAEPFFFAKCLRIHEREHLDRSSTHRGSEQSTIPS